jgi:ribulose-phosphate 3-epimerase
MMTHRERAALALSCKVPDYVPTFELEFQLAPELCGKDFVYPQQLRGLSGAELEYTLEQNAYYMAEVMDKLGYSIYTLCHLFPEEYSIRTARYMQKVTGGKVMLAINPATPVYSVEEMLEYIDGVTILTVNPGFAGQKIVRSCIKKTEKMRKLLDSQGYSHLEIEVDGNISFENARILRDLGADIFVAGTSSVFGGSYTEIGDRVAKLRAAIE